MLKGPVLKAGLPQLIRDTRRNLDAMKAEPSGRTDPFESIYRIVFQLTMRTVACHEIADDPKTLATCLHCFETIDKTGTPLTVMFPWMPLPAKFQRLKVGAQLYMIFQSVIEKRKMEEVKQKDALQFLLDQGDDAKGIITVSAILGQPRRTMKKSRKMLVSWLAKVHERAKQWLTLEFIDSLCWVHFLLAN
jgi:sterol 14-demethylase